MKRLAIFACLGFLFASLSFADDWSTYQHDPEHTGRSSANFDPSLLKKAWGSTQFIDPIVVGNSVYVIGYNGGPPYTTVSSLDLQNGHQNWSLKLPPIQDSELTYSEGVLTFLGFNSPGGTALYAIDAATGSQKYSLNVPAQGGPLGTTVKRNSNNQLVAYASMGDQISAVSLGATSATTLWTTPHFNATQSMPTVVGNSIIVAGPDQYYAFDQLTGAENHFFAGTSSGGGGVTVAFDSARSQFYVRDAFIGKLTAFSYTSNNSITQKWQVPDSFQNQSLSIGADGTIYYCTSASISALDPADGHVLRSLTGLSISNGTTPALSANSLFVYSDKGVKVTTEVYDLATFAHVATLPAGRIDENTPYESPGAVFDGGYILNYGPDSSTHGFDVYLAVPEPTTATLLLLGMLGCGWRRRRNS